MEQSESISNLGDEKKGLPKGLKILCILSLIMGGLMISGSLWNIKAFYAPSESDIERREMETKRLLQFNPDMAEQIYIMEGNKGVEGIIGLIVETASVIGVILMMKLKKTGFYIYMAGELLPYVISTAVKGLSQTGAEMQLMGGPIKSLGIVIFAVIVILDLLFIFLYSKQTKYLE